MREKMVKAAVNGVRTSVALAVACGATPEQIIDALNRGAREGNEPEKAVDYIKALHEVIIKIRGTPP